MLLYPPQAKHLWFQQKATKGQATVKKTGALLRGSAWLLAGATAEARMIEC